MTSIVSGEGFPTVSSSPLSVLSSFDRWYSATSGHPSSSISTSLNFAPVKLEGAVELASFAFTSMFT